MLNAETIPDVLRRAFLFAQAPPGGPTFVTFSKDMWEERLKRVEILPRSRSQLESSLHPDQLPGAIDRCLRAIDEGRPYLLDVKIQRRYGGADSTWYDFFSVAQKQTRQT